MVDKSSLGKVRNSNILYTQEAFCLTYIRHNCNRNHLRYKALKQRVLQATSHHVLLSLLR